MAFRSVLLCLALLLFASAASAKDPSLVSPSDKAAARDAMDRGDEHFKAGDNEKALGEYKKADAIMGVPSTGVLVGKAYEALGKWVEAYDVYLAVGRYQHTPGKKMPDAFVAAQGTAAERAEALDAKMPTLKIVLTELEGGLKPRIEINGEVINPAALTRRVNPGPIAIHASAEGYLKSTESVTVAEKETKTVTITLQKDPNYVGAATPPPTPDPTPAPTPTPTPTPPGGDQTGDGGGTLVPAIIAFSVGGAGLILGGVFGGLTFGKKSELEEACPEETACNDQDLIDSANTFANVSNAGFIVGGVGVVAGVILLVTLGFDDEPEAAAVMPILGPGTVGVTGRF